MTHVEQSHLKPDELSIPPRIEGVPEGLQRENLNAIVGAYDEYYDDLAQRPEYQKEDGSGPDNAKIENKLNWMIVDYVEQEGITSNPQTAKQRQEYELAFSVVKRAMQSDEEEWVGHRTDDNHHDGIANQVFLDLLDHYKPLVPYQPPAGRHRADTPVVRVDNDARNNLDQERDEASTRLFKLTEEYSKKVAERSKRMIEGSKTAADIDRLKDGYTEIVNGEEIYHEGLADLISALATEAYDDFEAEGLAQDEIVRKVDEFIAEQTESIVAQMEEHRMAEYNNSRFKWFYNHWARLGQKEGFITKGKIAKAAWVGAPSVLVGAAALPFIGAIGAGAGIGAVAFMGGRSIARRFAGAKIDAVAGSARVAEEQSTDIKARIDATSSREKAIKEGKLDLLEVIDERTHFYRVRNRNRMIAGTAIAMTVGLLSGTAAQALEGRLDNLGDWLFGSLNGDDTSDIKGHDRDGDGTINRFDHDRDGDGVRNGQDYAPNNPDITEAPTDDTGSGNLFEGHQGTRELTPEGRQALAEQLNGYKVKSGDSVWKLSEKFLHEQGNANPSVYEIDATKDVLLKELRASGNADSRGWLTTGDTIKIK